MCGSSGCGSCVLNSMLWILGLFVLWCFDVAWVMLGSSKGVAVVVVVGFPMTSSVVTVLVALLVVSGCCDDGVADIWSFSLGVFFVKNCLISPWRGPLGKLVFPLCDAVVFEGCVIVDLPVGVFFWIWRFLVIFVFES